ncbi:trehalose-phosphatase [Rhizobium mayense]|uniref:Trehalose 6-phosphate phosphatase n=1 Tax=Rhizobium mayense TaxID=1312184 RepID=A0ABT7JTG7_9HYPH|nr:trehalose-phosphatase [Rhizobium mayense]MDL2399018.1 trehalose-phosphatase [Rhizobium mayense]
MTYEEQPEQGEAQPAPPNEPALSALSLYPQEWALFLDIDGTLLDLAETPEAIVVPPSLPFALQALSRQLDGALALVTGRAVAFVDPLFAPFHFPVAGLHGAERRDAAGRLRRALIPPAFQEMKRVIAQEVGAWPGVLVEDKGAAVAVHYRLAPEREGDVAEAMQRYLQEAGPDWILQHGKLVVEICPAHASKGHAVEAFLGEPPFSGRRPLAIGDDVTDETMFGVANRLGGQSVRVGTPSGKTLARASIPSPARLREILAALAK